MAKFQNKFFSAKGQKERLKNVVQVLKAPFTGGRVLANTKSPTVNKVLEAVSNNPFKTAAVAGTVANIPKATKAVQMYRASKAARAAEARSKQVTPLATNNKPGVIDLSELDRAPSNAPGMLNPTTTGGLLNKAKTLVNPSANQSAPRSSSPRPRRAKRRRSSPSRRRTRRSRSRRTSKRSSRRSRRRFGSSAQYDKPGGKRVYRTKTGQPYILLADGRARFIKKSKR